MGKIVTDSEQIISGLNERIIEGSQKLDQWLLDNRRRLAKTYLTLVQLSAIEETNLKCYFDRSVAVSSSDSLVIFGLPLKDKNTHGIPTFTKDGNIINHSYSYARAALFNGTTIQSVITTIENILGDIDTSVNHIRNIALVGDPS